MVPVFITLITLFSLAAVYNVLKVFYKNYRQKSIIGTSTLTLFFTCAILSLALYFPYDAISYYHNNGKWPDPSRYGKFRYSNTKKYWQKERAKQITRYFTNSLSHVEDSLLVEKQIELINQLVKRSSFLHKRKKEYYITHEGVVKPIKDAKSIIKDFALKELLSDTLINLFNSNIQDLFRFADYISSVSFSKATFIRKGKCNFFPLKDGYYLSATVYRQAIKDTLENGPDVTRLSFNETTWITGIHAKIGGPRLIPDVVGNISISEDGSLQEKMTDRFRSKLKEYPFVRNPLEQHFKEQIIVRMINLLKLSSLQQDSSNLISPRLAFLFTNKFISKFQTSPQAFCDAINNYDVKRLLRKENNHIENGIDQLHHNPTSLDEIYFFSFYDKSLELKLGHFTKKIKRNEEFELKENEWIVFTSISNNTITYEGYFFQFNDWKEELHW